MSRGDLPGAWPAGSGEVASLIRTTDWAKTPLGPCHSWPQGLRSVLDLMLSTQVAMALFWGPDKRAFYNDACVPFMGSQHSQVLGQPGSACLSEWWGDLEPLLMKVWNSGQPFSVQDRPFLISRQGPRTTAYFDISLSAVRDEADTVAGVLCIVNETTQRLLDAQALAGKEAALRTEQEFARLLLESTTEGFYAVDRDGATTRCNAAFLEMLGYDSADEVLGRKLCHKIAPSPADHAQVSAVVCPIQLADLAGKSFRVTEAIFCRKDGTHFPVDYRVEPIWRRGLLDGAICTFSDASERLLGQQIKQAREKAESDLRETHEQLRLAEAAGGIGTFLLEIKTDHIIASDEFCRLFGLPIFRPLTAGMVESVLLRESADVVSNVASRQSGDALLNVEYRIKKADTGEIRWISRRAEFVRDDSGKPVWMRGVVQDVTERKLAEATLHESESRFRVLAQAVPNQVWSATPEGQLDWVNQKVVDYSGLEEKELLSNGWIRLVHPADRQSVSAQWQHALQQKTRYETEFRLQRHDGIYRWHLSRALPIVSEGATRWLGSNTDIEEQKAAG